MTFWISVGIVEVVQLGLFSIILTLALRSRPKADHYLDIHQLLQDYRLGPQEELTGLWLHCPVHGDLPLSVANYNKCRCPACGGYPKKVWRDEGRKPTLEEFLTAKL